MRLVLLLLALAACSKSDNTNELAEYYGTKIYTVNDPDAGTRCYVHQHGISCVKL